MKNSVKTSAKKSAKQLFTIVLEQTNNKNEINFKTSLDFQVKDEESVIKATATYIVDFVDLQNKLKEHKLSLYGVKGLTKTGKIHITLRSKSRQTCEFCIRNFGKYIQQSTEQQIAEIMGYTYKMMSKHSNAKY